MYFVGIDISKFKHDCAIIDELGDVITSSWSFNNDREGFSQFKQLLDALGGQKKIGFESTGHYGQNLKLFLETNGFSFMEINPLLISRFVRSKSLRNTKTDTIDAEYIAQISDDTQMTLFTANGLLIGTTRGMTRGIMGTYPSYIALCYKDWLRTQTADEFGFEPPEYSWLNNIPEMNHSRAPGRTCISYLIFEHEFQQRKG